MLRRFLWRVAKSRYTLYTTILAIGCKDPKKKPK